MHTVWITGRPGVGKSTLAKKLFDDMHLAILLDSDTLRRIIGYNDYSKQGRVRWMNIVAKMAAELEQQGFTPLVAIVSPYRGTRPPASRGSP